MADSYMRACQTDDPDFDLRMQALDIIVHHVLLKSRYHDAIMSAMPIVGAQRYAFDACAPLLKQEMDKHGSPQHPPVNSLIERMWPAIRGRVDWYIDILKICPFAKSYAYNHTMDASTIITNALLFYAQFNTWQNTWCIVLHLIDPTFWSRFTMHNVTALLTDVDDLYNIIVTALKKYHNIHVQHWIALHPDVQRAIDTYQMKREKRVKNIRAVSMIRKGFFPDATLDAGTDTNE